MTYLSLMTYFDILNLLDLLWPLLTYSEKFWPNLTYMTYIDLLWPTLTYFELHWPTLSYLTQLPYIHLLWHNSNYFDLFWPYLTWPTWPTLTYITYLTYFGLLWPTLPQIGLTSSQYQRKQEQEGKKTMCSVGKDEGRDSVRWGEMKWMTIFQQFQNTQLKKDTRVSC